MWLSSASRPAARTGQFCARSFRRDFNNSKHLRAWNVDFGISRSYTSLAVRYSTHRSRRRAAVHAVQRRGVDAGERESPVPTPPGSGAAAREGCGGTSPAAAGPDPVSGQTSRFRGSGLNIPTRTPEANHVKRGTIPLPRGHRSNTCRGRGIRASLFLPVDRFGDCQTTRGIPRPRALHLFRRPRATASRTAWSVRRRRRAYPRPR